MDVTLAGSALTRNWSDAELQGISIELSAFDGQIGNSTIPIPDPTGADEVPPGLSLVVEEGSTLLLSGIIVSEGRSRGFDVANPNKKDDYTVEDPNTFLYGFRVTDWVRPEETDYERMAAFFAEYLPSVTTSQILNTSTTTMVAATYNSDGVTDIMRDAIDITGKTLFLHDLSSGGICAHWHALTGGHTCGLTIDDSDPSVNGPTDWLPQNPSRVKDGHDLANDILAYGSADLLTPVNVLDATSIAAYDVDGKRHQTFAQFPEATDLTTLTADANRLLATNKDPRDTWTCTIGPLDETALANIRVGDIITCTSTVMTLSASPQRIASLRLTVAGGLRVAPTLWMAELTLGAPVRGPVGRPSARPPVLRPAAPSIFNPPDGGSSCFYDYFSRTNSPGWGNDWGYVTGVVTNCDPVVPEANGTAGIMAFGPSTTTPGLGWSTDTQSYRTIPLQAGEFSLKVGYHWDNLPQDSTGFTGIRVNGLKAGAGWFTCSTETDELGVGDIVANADSMTSGTAVSKPNWSPGPYAMDITYSPGVGVKVTTGGYTVVDANASALPGIDKLTIVGVAADGEFEVRTLYVDYIEVIGCTPSAGQYVPLELIATSDGSTTDYNTAHPYVPGSLKVIVGGLPWAAGGYEETDPTTGAWQFLQVPISLNVIRAEYVAA